jgi:hypothetical protein
MFSRAQWLAISLLFAWLSGNLLAVDGVILIDQNRALAGGITPGDAPGFPITITQPGSYRLAGNLTVSDLNTDAIDVNSNDVVIDLNGFRIAGPTVCAGSPLTCSPNSGFGIGVNGNGSNIVVRNGTVRGMPFAGISLGGGGCAVKDMYLVSSRASGALVDNCTVSGSAATQNGETGITADNSTIIGNTTNGNGRNGISVVNSTVVNNTVTFNGEAGIIAFCPSTIIGNTVVANGSDVIPPGTPGGCAVANNASQ